MTGSRSDTNTFPDSELFVEIASELGVEPAFVEKDWYAVQALRAIAEFQSADIKTIFAGGTSLSKAHGLIKRFSEDLDFRCQFVELGSQEKQKRWRRRYRKGVIEILKDIDFFELDEDRMEIGGKHLKFPLAYPQNMDRAEALRPHLQVEFSYTQPRLAPVLCEVRSLVGEFTDAEPEVTVDCLSSLETAADKLSALVWRVLKRDRNSPKDDPAMIRHLHDLSALRGVIDSAPALFSSTVLESFQEDQLTANRKLDGEFGVVLTDALALLSSDSGYAAEYANFVDAMSYADDEERIEFETAVEDLEGVQSLFE